MSNININGQSAVHAKSEGKLITSSTCLTPPFCIPITYTNVAESKMADLTASTVKIQGSPACNSMSNFKISKGDAPGCCGGLHSGTTCQLAEFITYSNDVMIEGKPAVRNGDKMVSNNRNTDIQPLIQPPAEKAPAKTAEAPAQEGEFSQQFDFMEALGNAPGKPTIIERPVYEIWSKAGNKLDWGYLDKQGLTERVYTDEPTELIVWLGDGAWRFYQEQDHGEYDSEAEVPTTASISFVFFNFAMAYLPELEYKLVSGNQSVTGKTGINGVTQALEELAPNSKVEVWVQKEASKEYKKIGTVIAYAGENHYQAISPKIKAEGKTEDHKNPPAAAPKAEATPPAKNSEKKKAPPQKPKTDAAASVDNHPQAKMQPDKTLLLASQPVLAALMYSTWSMLKNFNRLITGNESLNTATIASPAKPGTPLDKSDLARLQALVKFAEKQVNFDYRDCVDDNGAHSIERVLDKYEHTHIGDPSFEHELKPHEKEKSNKPHQSIGLCLWYVKIALMQTRYVNGRPAAGQAKESVNDWKDPRFGYSDISKELPQVLITYEHAYAEEDLSKVNKALEKDAKVKQLTGQLKSLNAKLAAAHKAKDHKKTEATHKEIDNKNSELDAARKEADKANADKPEKSKAVYTQPDLTYTLPGDLIVYEQVDPVELNAAGHIDIRTYHGFCSDFAWQRPFPALGQSSTKRYKVIGVYRKISDTMATTRVQAFLRIIRELEAKDYSEPYRALPRDHGKEVLFSSFDTHPSSRRDDVPSGAYQIRWNAWNEVTNLTGWPKTFTPEMQDRIAIHRLQQRPMEKVTKFPRRTALGYIMEGKIEQAINESKLWEEWACLPGASDNSQAQIAMGEIKKRYKEYSGEDAK